MTAESTETSSEVPDDYPGILDARVQSDENGDVQELPDFMKKEQEVAEETKFAKEMAYRPRYAREETLRFVAQFLPYVHGSDGTTTITSILDAAREVEEWLDRPVD